MLGSGERDIIETCICETCGAGGDYDLCDTCAERCCMPQGEKNHMCDAFLKFTSLTMDDERCANRHRVWFFDQAHCEDLEAYGKLMADRRDNTLTLKVRKVFNVSPVHEVSGFEEDNIIIVIADNSQKCYLCHHRWLPCEEYEEYEVRKAADGGLDQIGDMLTWSKAISDASCGHSANMDKFAGFSDRAPAGIDASSCSWDRFQA